MLRIFILVGIFSAIFASVPTSIAQAPVRTLNEYSIPELVEHYASQYKVSALQMLGTIKCESSFRTDAVGDGGHSFGLSQIYLPAHPEITKEQAINKVFAIEFMAREFSLGNQRIWTCWRTNYN